MFGHFSISCFKGVRGSTEIELQFIDFVLSPFWKIGLSFAVLMILRNTVGSKWFLRSLVGKIGIKKKLQHLY